MTAASFVDPSQPHTIDTLQIVFKVAERCNINCSYCYYFNMGHTSALSRPATVSLETVRAMADWIVAGCEELAIPKVMIAFHGGEPMLLKAQHFGAICQILRERITPAAQLKFSIQTNGTILNDAWLELFRAHSVRVGVSIDGDRAAHDRYRLDHRSRSTFDRTEQNIRRLVAWAGEEKPLVPATISVLDSRNDYRRIYAYLRSLGIEQMSFLLPDRSVDTGFTEREAAGRAYGDALLAIFEAWLTEDNPTIFIRYIWETLAHFQVLPEENPGEQTFEPGEWPSRNVKKRYQIVVVQSDGTVTVNDSFIPALVWYQKTPVYSIFHSSLKEFLSDRIFADIGLASDHLPGECQACRWKRVCKAGDLENRFSEQNGFDNPSIYCQAYKTFYQGVCDLLVHNGYPADRVQSQVLASPGAM